MSYRLPPEWAPQDAVMLTWPHADTDWAPRLATVDPTYVEIAGAILKRQALVVICHNQDIETHVRGLLAKAQINTENLLTVIAPCNDTWARDHGPITVINDAAQTPVKTRALDFTFNGWGNKYAWNLDNAISEALLGDKRVAAQHQTINLVLEGGGIEVDDSGHLLTTEQCLLNPNRNPALSRQDIEAQLQEAFGVQSVLWLKHGELDGDDTDSHIDTLARLAPDNTIVYVQCDDPEDSHFSELEKMTGEITELRTNTGEAFRLLPLPWPKACINGDGERLPATYANYLVINQAVLVPTYNQPEKDKKALAQIQLAFPEREIIGINCLALIEQFGSLHCITMQLPGGFLKRP